MSDIEDLVAQLKALQVQKARLLDEERQIVDRLAQAATTWFCASCHSSIRPSLLVQACLPLFSSLVAYRALTSFRNRLLLTLLYWKPGYKPYITLAHLRFGNGTMDRLHSFGGGKASIGLMSASGANQCGWEKRKLSLLHKVGWGPRKTRNVSSARSTKFAKEDTSPPPPRLSLQSIISLSQRVTTTFELYTTGPRVV